MKTLKLYIIKSVNIRGFHLTHPRRFYCQNPIRTSRRTELNTKILHVAYQRFHWNHLKKKKIGNMYSNRNSHPF